MKKISKGTALGEPINDPREFLRLAAEGKSVVHRAAYTRTGYEVKPAAFFIHWPLIQILKGQFFYSIKLENEA